MSNQLKILICDDNIAVHESISAYLKLENMESLSAYDGEEALQKAINEQVDLIILDIMMPKISGTEVCREIRKKKDVPIIMLSARSEEFDRILGLELGADDYITKPFSPREVVARIRTIMKRVQPRTSKEKMVIGALVVDPEGYEALINGIRLETTPKEVETLIYLASNKNKVISREQILNKVWGYDYFGDTRAVDTIIKRLRQKLPEGPLGFEIKAVYGVGYKLEAEK